MSTAAYRPPRLAPPHDPLRMRLSASDGWRDAGAGVTTGIDVPRGSGALTLSVVSPPGPGLLDPFGILGGLAPPANVALSPDGAIYLLDRTGRRLLWFDACTCRFLPLPCLLPPGPADPRALSKPVAIAAGKAVLAMADGVDGGRVVVMARRNLAVREVLQHDWLPGPLAMGHHGQLYVTDRKAGAVYRFTPDFRLASVLTGLGSINNLAVDRHDRLYVVSDDAVRRFTPAGVALDQPGSVDAIRDAFAPLPFGIDALGRLILGALCKAAGGTPVGAGLFDAAGNPVSSPPSPWPDAVYQTTGRFVSTALDSRIAGCVWHRIVLHADLPAHARLTVRARTDEIEMPIDFVSPVGDADWTAPQSWRVPLKCAVECLFTCRPGRFLWLELTLEGPGVVTPRITAAVIEFPRIPLRRYLPAAFATDPVNGEFADRFLALFDQNFRSIESRLDNAAELFDPRSTPAGMLIWLAGWVGLPLPSGVTLA
jgi:hypothetical protein